MLCDGHDPSAWFSSLAGVGELHSSLPSFQQHLTDSRPADISCWLLTWDPCEIATLCAIEELTDLVAEAGLGNFTLFCLNIFSSLEQDAAEIRALKAVFGLALQLPDGLLRPEGPPPLPAKLVGVRRPLSEVGIIGSAPQKIPFPAVPPGIGRGYTDQTDRTDLTGHTEYPDSVASVAYDTSDYGDYGDHFFASDHGPAHGLPRFQVPPQPRHRFHVRGKAEIFANNGRSFTKKQRGRLSLVSEDRVHQRGVERYRVSFLAGELSRADGVGIIFSSSLPKNSDIQQIVSLFLNRTGRLCSRVNQRVTRIASSLPPFELGDVVQVENDIDLRCVTFTIWSAVGGDTEMATVSYAQVADQLAMCEGQPVPGHLAVVVKHPGVSVALLS